MTPDTSNIKTLAEVVQFFTTRLEGLGDPDNQQVDSNAKQLAEQNIIPGPGSTLGIGIRSVSPRLNNNERSRVYEIGTLLAKAQYNFNLTKKVDKKDKTLLRQPGIDGLKGDSLGKKSKSDSQGGESSSTDSLIDTITDLFDGDGDGKKRRRRGRRRGRGRGRGRGRTRGRSRSGTRGGTRSSSSRGGQSRGLSGRGKPKGRFGRISSAVRSITDKVMGRGGKSPGGGSRVSRAIKSAKDSVTGLGPKVSNIFKSTKDSVTGLGPKVSNIFKSTKDSVTGFGTRATTGIKNTLGIAPKATGAVKGAGGVSKVATATSGVRSVLGSIMPALGRVGTTLGTVGKVVGKVAAPLALAVDGVTAVTKLSSEAGRENLRATAESLDYQKDFFGTLGKSLFSPLETASAIGLATYDLVESSKAAAKSEANLKKAEAKSQEKTETYDSDKSGKIDTIEEKLKLWNSADSGPSKMKFYNDKAGKKWRYDKQTDTFTSLEGNVQMSSKDFVKRENQKNGIVPPEPELKQAPPSNVIASQSEQSPLSPVVPQTIQSTVSPVSPETIPTSEPLMTTPPPATIVQDQLKPVDIAPISQPTSITPIEPKAIGVVNKATGETVTSSQPTSITPIEPKAIGVVNKATGETVTSSQPGSITPVEPKAIGVAGRAVGEIVKNEVSIKLPEVEKTQERSAEQRQPSAAVDLSGQNNLIVQQTQILSELLRISKMQLGVTEKMKPSIINNSSGGSTQISAPGRGTNTSSETSRSMYSSSPYTLSPV